MRAPPAACAARPPSRRPISTKPPTARGRRRRRRDERWASRSAGQPFKGRSAWTEWSAMDDRSIDRGVPRALPTQKPTANRSPPGHQGLSLAVLFARPWRARALKRRAYISPPRAGQLARQPRPGPAPGRHPGPGVKRAPIGECKCNYAHVTVAGPVAVNSPPCLHLRLEGTDRSIGTWQEYLTL